MAIIYRSGQPYGRRLGVDKLVGPRWLEENLAAPDLRILDCSVVFERPGGVLNIESGRERWNQEHIPGSVHVDLMTELADQTAKLLFTMPPDEQLVSVMESAGVGDGTRVVLYDFDINMWAARVWWMLHAIGFDEAAILDGGLRRWKAEGRSVTADPAPRHPRAALTVRPRPGIFVGKEEVLAAIEDDDIAIVDALPAAHYNGVIQFYKRRGHIPTAVNVPAGSIVDSRTHAYADADELRNLATPALEAGCSRTIAYCGGGISAASTAFALSRLGLEQISIYDGSMSEWAADPSLPLEDPASG